MKLWSKPTLFISKCLGEHKCRYNGESSTSSTLNSLKPYINLIEICPEESIGLPTPRETIRLINTNGQIRLINPKTLVDYTSKMTEFTNEIAIKLDNENIQGFLLKTRSPSCGIRDVKIYSSAEKGCSSSKGKGLFGGKIYELFSYLPMEEDGRIKNFTIREHFLTRIFILAEFHDVVIDSKLSTLIDFHSKNKLLFMAYNQTGLKRLGRIVANHENLEEKDVFDQYYKELCKQISKAPRYTSVINVFMYSMGYFNEKLSHEEKKFFLETLEKFRLGKVPQSVLINLLKSYAIRFNNEYLLSQSFLEPYPEDLMDLTDSGKGIVR